MEMSSRKHLLKRASQIAVANCLFMLLAYLPAPAQTSPPQCTIKEGKMFIKLSKELSDATLDSFISKYSLEDLALKQFIKSGFKDSIRSLGWEIFSNDRYGFIITKPMIAFDEYEKPSDKLKYLEKLQK